MHPYSSAAERNRGPILAVLRDVLPRSGQVLEVAAGTGQHAVYFARHLPGLFWQPTDVDPVALRSIEARRGEARLENLYAPRRLDVTEPVWPVSTVDAVVCCNLLHIAPWSACEALFQGASAILTAAAPIIVYGPFVRRDVPTAPTNLAFDAQLRARDSSWGIRALEDVKAAADKAGFSFEDLVEMPANNLIITFRHRAVHNG